MQIRPLCLFPLLGSALSLTAGAGLVVELEKLDDVTTQDFGTAFSPPWRIGGDVLYSKTDDSEGASPYGIYRNGALQLEWGDEIDGSKVNNVYILGVSGGSYLMSAFANYIPGSPNSYYTGLHLMPAGQRILDMTTTYPGYPTPLPRNLVGGGSFDNGNVAFLIRSTDIAPAQPASIMYWQGGSITKIATRGDPIPGSASTFRNFDHSNLPFAEGGKVVFAGEGSGAAGVYEWSGGGLTKVVDSSTPAPQGGTLGSFFNQSCVVKHGADYAFVTGSSNTHLYKIANGQLSLVASNQTPVPGGTGNFFNFHSPTLRDGKVVFLGWRSNQFSPPLEYGIYTDLGGTVEPIVDVRTDFGGRTPVSFSINPGHAWVDDAVYFQVAFDNNTDAIYRATFRAAPDRLESEVVFTSPRSGTITVETEAGKTYTLKRSAALDRSTAETLSSQAGTGSPLPFSFGPPDPPPGTMFYWVESD